MFAIYLMFLCKFPFAKVRRNLHSHNTLCMAFLYTKRLVFGIFWLMSAFLLSAFKLSAVRKRVLGIYSQVQGHTVACRYRQSDPSLDI